MKKTISTFVLLFAALLFVASCGSKRATCDAYGSTHNQTESDVASK